MTKEEMKEEGVRNGNIRKIDIKEYGKIMPFKGPKRSL